MQWSGTAHAKMKDEDKPKTIKPMIEFECDILNCHSPTAAAFYAAVATLGTSVLTRYDHEACKTKSETITHTPRSGRYFFHL
jgi:hypothetical protein